MKSQLNMTQNEQVYEICCRPEVAGDVISGWNAKTTGVYMAVSLELLALAASNIYFRWFGGGGEGQWR